MGVASSSPCEAAALRVCEPPVPLSPEQQDRLFRFADVIKSELEASGRSLALVARSGLDLGRFGVRYSHAGISLKAGPATPWSVRQLYYACDERRPRLYDQGMAGFVQGVSDPAVGYVSVVFVPTDAAEPLERSVREDGQALRLLGASYSANAYAFSASYQNCNQWVIETLAAAWGSPDVADNPRGDAQAWLKEQGYLPTVFDLGFAPMMWFAAAIPWLHDDDHPAEDLARNVFRVSMPASIEDFVRARMPGAERVEFCHTGRRVVVHRGWDSIPEGCVPGAKDDVVVLD